MLRMISVPFHAHLTVNIIFLNTSMQRPNAYRYFLKTKFLPHTNSVFEEKNKTHEHTCPVIVCQKPMSNASRITLHPGEQ